MSAKLKPMWFIVEWLTLEAVFRQPDPRPLPVAAKDFEGEPRWEAMIRGLRSLQEYYRGEVFPLSYRDAGKLLGVGHRYAHLMLNHLVRVGVLRLVATGNRGGPSTWLFITGE